MTRIVQIQKGSLVRVALVREPRLQLLGGAQSSYELAAASEASRTPLLQLIQERATTEELDYDTIYQGKSDWHLLPPIHHPVEPARCLVSGTGLTHLGSAKNRQAMHSANEEELNDSMKMFKWGVEGGKPSSGKIGLAPEWFYKGNGSILRAHGQPLEVPSFAEDGGEEGEIAGIYLVGSDGAPRRIGMAIGNEFSDHKFEKRNYLNLAGSKLRNCALGPELVIDPEFDFVPGKVSITRGDSAIWSQAVSSGEREMCHSLANIEHHHFKFDAHRRPGDLHVHYFGACSLSYGAGIELADGDVMEISFSGFGRPLQNALWVAKNRNELVSVRSMAGTDFL